MQKIRATVAYLHYPRQTIMKKLLGILLLAFLVLMQAQPWKGIVSGVSWYDQRGETVSAHGANIIRDGGRYYLFGEYKTDSATTMKSSRPYLATNSRITGSIVCPSYLFPSCMQYARG